jgi:hypothetical protein
MMVSTVLIMLVAFSSAFSWLSCGWPFLCCKMDFCLVLKAYLRMRRWVMAMTVESFRVKLV